jgi:hypothetical protein
MVAYVYLLPVSRSQVKGDMSVDKLVDTRYALPLQ